MSIINNAHQNYQRLAQLLSAYGNSFLPVEEDDGQASLFWENEKLWSREANGVRMGLDYRSGQIIFEGELISAEIATEGKSVSTLFNEIKRLFRAHRDFKDQYKLDFNYELDFDLWEETLFKLPEEKVIDLLIKWRSLAEQSLNEVNDAAEYSTDIRVWPHHFDTGRLLGKDKDLEKGFGLGYAIADHVSQSPYYYVYEWPKREINYANFDSEIRGAKWVDQDNWKGAILLVSSDITVDKVVGFFKESVDNLKAD